jgi:phage terminase small subunit
MGQRGPQPKPAALQLVQGNPGKKPIAQLLGEFKPDVEIPDYPAWLWPEAKKEWKRITPELERYGLISKLDRAALVRYVQAWAEYVWAKKMLGQEMRRAAARLAAFEKERADVEAAGGQWTRGEWKGGDGFQVPTPNGSLAYSPYWVAAKRAGDEVDKCLASFGLSPSARSRVMQSDQYPFLPGLQPGGDNAGEGAGAAPKATLASFAR